MITKEEILQAYKSGKITDEKTLATFVMTRELEKKIDEEIPHIKNIISRVKGDKGDKGEDGYTPKKGKDYFDGKDGRDGKDGKDGKSIKGDKGDPGKDGKSPDPSQIVTKATESAISAVKPLIPNITDIENNLPMLGERIRDGLETLRDDQRLDASAIRNLPDNISKEVIRIGGGSAGINVYAHGVKCGSARTIDFENASFSKVNGRETLTFVTFSDTAPSDPFVGQLWCDIS